MISFRELIAGWKAFQEGQPKTSNPYPLSESFWENSRRIAWDNGWGHAEKHGDLSEEHTELKEEAVCPYCGYIDDCSYEHFQSHETEKDVSCPSCEKEFSIEMIVDVSYTTKRKK